MKIIMIAMVMLAVAVPALAAEKGYPTPDVSKSRLIYEEKQVVKDRTPATEIDIRTYKADDGSLFREYSVKGNIFRYDVAPKGEPPYEYRLIDYNGDKVFETKEDMIGEMVVKDKGRKYYIDLGAEPGKEYKYGWEERTKPPTDQREVRDSLMGYPIYIPQWVLVVFDIP